MATSYEIKATIKAVDNVSGPMAKITRSASVLGKRFGGLSKSAKAFGSSLKLITPQFATIAIGLVSIGSITKLVDSVSSFGDKIAKASARVGFAIENFQKWQYVADLSGVSNEEFTKSLEIMTKQMGQMRAGTGTLITELSKYSPALLKQLQATQSNEEAFVLMTDAIRNVSDPAKKAYLATIFFGGSGQKMVAMANMSKESLAELTAEFERLGGVMGEDTAKNSEIYQDSLTKLKTAMQGVGNLLVGSFLPALIKVIDKIRDWISENRELLNQKIGELVKSFVAWVERIDFDNLLKGIEEIIRGIGAVIDFCGGLKKAFIALMLIMNAGVIVSFLKLGVELLILGKTILPLLIMAIKKLSIVMIGAIRAIGAAMLANPIIIVITAIIAVVALLAYMIYKYWEPIKAFLLNLWETIKTATIAAWNGIKNYFISLWESIKAIFSTGWEFIKTVFSYSPLGLIIEHWGGIVDVFSGIWEGVKNGAVNAFTGIKDFIIGIVDWIWKYSGLDKVLAAIGMVKGWFAGDEGELPTAEQSKAHRKGESPLITPTAGAAQAEVVVRFDNMPRGAQASPGGVSGGFDLGLETSYALPSGVR